MATVTKTVHIGGQVPESLARQFADVAKGNERAVAAELRLALKAHIEAHTPHADAKAGTGS